MSDRALFQALLLKSDAPAQETESALRILREWVKKSRQEIPSALNRMLVTTAIGTEAAMMPDDDQRRTPSRPVSSIGPRPGTPEATGTMADILPATDPVISPTEQRVTGLVGAMPLLDRSRAVRRPNFRIYDSSEKRMVPGPQWMKSALASTHDRIQRGQTLTGHPLARR